jgi:hypothetical protein
MPKKGSLSSQLHWRGPALSEAEGALARERAALSAVEGCRNSDQIEYGL